MNKKHSKDYETFLRHYFTGHAMIRMRGEEDTTVWQRFEGEELEMAKRKIIDNLSTYDPSYVTAVGIFRDARAIEPLKEIAESGPNIHIKTHAEKTLFDWIGYEDYFSFLDELFGKGGQWSKINLFRWIDGLEEEDALRYFWRAIQDEDSFVRFCAIGDLKHYYGIRESGTDASERKYFTDDKVFQNKELLNERLEELKEEIERWRTTEKS